MNEWSGEIQVSTRLLANSDLNSPLCTGSKMAVLSTSSAPSVPCSREVQCHFDEPMRCIEAVRNS